MSDMKSGFWWDTLNTQLTDLRSGFQSPQRVAAPSGAAAPGSERAGPVAGHYPIAPRRPGWHVVLVIIENEKQSSLTHEAPSKGGRIKGNFLLVVHPQPTRPFPSERLPGAVMKRGQTNLMRVPAARLVLLFGWLLAGNLVFPLGVAAEEAAATKSAPPAGTVAPEKARPEAKSTPSDLLPAITVGKGKYGTYVTVRSPTIPGLVVDLWCYELGVGEPVAQEQEGNAMVLVHQSGTAKVTSRFEPCLDGVDIRVTVTGPDAEAVRGVKSLNPCCLFDRAPAFKGTGDYVDDFVARCFVFLDSGLTMLKDTKRIPGNRTKDGPRANGPKPWIQEYYPAWRKLPAAKDDRRPTSTDRPVYPIIGVVSCDGQHLAAIAWPETSKLGQVWHYCFHPRPVIAESFDPATGEIKSHGRIYFLANDPSKLLARFQQDFPNWQRPPDAQ